MMWAPTHKRKLEWAGEKHGLIAVVHKALSGEIFCKVLDKKGKVFWKKKSTLHLIEGFAAAEAMIDFFQEKKESK